MAALTALLVGLLMLAASRVVIPQQNGPGASFENPSFSRKESTTQDSHGPGLSDLHAPLYATHLDDVAQIFALAKVHGIVLGQIDYRNEPNSSLPIRVRTLDLHIAEDYPKFKPFVADLLATMPHLFLQEIRVERGNAETSKAQITLKVSLIYKMQGHASALEKAPLITAANVGAPQ